jgi:signal transduction histidine kinase
VTDRTIVIAVRAAAATGIALAAIGTAVSVASGDIDDWWAGHYGVATMITVGLCGVVWLVIPRQPRNASVWAMATAPLGALVVAGFAFTSVSTDADASALRYPNYVPAEHPTWVAIVFMVGEACSHLGLFVPLTFGLLLFPSGSLPGRRWRWVAWWSAGSLAAVAASYVLASRPGFAGSPDDWAPLGISQFALLAAMLIAVMGLLVRFRASSGDVRQQCKWLLWGGAFAAVFFGAGMASAGSGADVVSPLLVFVGFAALLASYAVAMVHHRLYDVDLVISRTIVYATLAAIITGAYVGIVVGVGRSFGAGDEPATYLAIVTTAAVAAAFQPLRRRLQRVVDRLVSGRRATPHEVLSEFTRRISANDDRLLEVVARSLVDGTVADRAEIRVRRDGRMVCALAWPSADPKVGDERATTIPISHHGVELGQLVLSTSPGQRMSEQDRMLAAQVASGMGLALSNRSLTDTLERRVVELRDSRRRLVALQDETRRRLERDLHDGAQQQLVALRVKLGLARKIAQADGATQTDTILARLADQADALVDRMREFARGIYPPLLEAEGLEAAIAAVARRSPIPVSVSTDGIDRYERDVESTVNVCISEALRNVAEHAGASRARVRLDESDGVLTFEVCDDGQGFDVDASAYGVGLTNMADRIDALAGTLRVLSTPEGGTQIVGVVPVDAGSPASATGMRQASLVGDRGRG